MLILVGKSCSGKSTIQKELIKIGLPSVLEYTTRPTREYEINGKSYYFVSERDFISLKRNGFFAVTTSYKASTGEIWKYGIALQDISDGKMVVTNPMGLKKLKEYTNIHPISFYINADENIIWDRLVKRKDNIDEAQRRLIADRIDFSGIEQCVDFVFTNNGRVKPFLLANTIKYVYRKYIDNLVDN